MDNWNVIAAQTSSSAMGRDDLNLFPKEKLVNDMSLKIHSLHHNSSENASLIV